jgi:hypothetical protein
MNPLLGGLLGQAMGGHYGDIPPASSGGVSSEQVDQAKRRALEVDHRLSKLSLICMAMWSLLREKTGLTEEELLERVKQIDLLDGKVDGQITPQIARCGQCNRVMNLRHKKCIYCGHERLVLSAFDTLT